MSPREVVDLEKTPDCIPWCILWRVFQGSVAMHHWIFVLGWGCVMALIKRKGIQGPILLCSVLLKLEEVAGMRLVGTVIEMRL